MMCFINIFCAVFTVIFSGATVPDYIIVKSSTDFRRNFTVNLTGAAAEHVYFFRNQVILGSCVENTCNECRHRGSSCELTSMHYARNYYITVQLTIANIQRTSWDETISVSNGTNLTSAQYFKQVYRLIIYTEIEHVDCRFQAVKEGIRMNCSAPDIFPNANSFCIFNNTARINGSCKEINSTEAGFLKNVTCSFNIAKDQLRVGDTHVSTTMYLDITGDENTDINFGRNIANILHLEYHTVTLGAECTETYILEGQTGHCTCHRTDTSDVAPDIVWCYPNNTIAAGGSRLSFTATRNSSFICRSRFSFGWSVNHTYTPNVAYGPVSVNFSLDPNDEDIHLCEDTQTKKKGVPVTYECTASEADPSISIEIMHNDEVLNRSMKIYSVTYIILVRGGVHIFSCLAKNAKFGNVNVSKTLTKNVIEAPNKPKITMQTDTNRNVRNMNAAKNTIYIIQCEVLGGYPLVSNITLECGPYTNVSLYSDTATLAVNATTPDLEDMNCCCSASHISRCYCDNKLVVPLRNLLSQQELELELCCFTKKGILIFSLTMAGTVVLFVVTLTCLITHNKYGWRKCLLALTHKQTEQLDPGMTVSYSNYNDIEMATIQNHHYNQLGDTETGDMDNLSHHYSHVESQVPLRQAGDPSVTSGTQVVLDSQYASGLTNSYLLPTCVGEPNTDSTNRRSQTTQTSSDGYITIIDHYSNID